MRTTFWRRNRKEIHLCALGVGGGEGNIIMDLKVTELGGGGY